jgi:hypothetical protein
MSLTDNVMATSYQAPCINIMMDKRVMAPFIISGIVMATSYQAPCILLISYGIVMATS